MQDAEGKTAMHWAAAGGRTELLKLLVQMGASTEIADSTGRLPLHCAAQVLLMPLCFALALLHRLISLKLHLLLLEVDGTFSVLSVTARSTQLSTTLVSHTNCCQISSC